ncbi:MAG: TonB-dependent receptor plug domain-containing protein, partial [Myxococcota bacterium]
MSTLLLPTHLGRLSLTAVVCLCAVLLEMTSVSPSWAQEPQVQGGQTLQDEAEGQEGDDTDFEEEMDDEDLIIVVTGSRTEKRLADTPVATEVITREEMIQAGAENVAEVLQEKAGVQINRSFAGATVQMQGLGSEYVLVLVDGQRVNGRIGGAVDMERFTVENIERIEIVRGASSALYGADALGGVINIITRKADQPFRVEANAKVGTTQTPSSLDSADGIDLRGSLSAKSGGTSGRLTGSWHDFEAYDLDPSNEATTGSARSQQDVTGQLTFELGSDVDLGLRGEYVQRRLEGVDVSGSGATFDRLNISEYAMFSAQPSVELGDGARFKALMGYAIFRDQFLSDQRFDDSLDTYEETLEHTGELRLQLDLPLADAEHLLTLGVEGFVEVLNADRLDSQGERLRGTVLVQDDW